MNPHDQALSVLRSVVGPPGGRRCVIVAEALCPNGAAPADVARTSQYVAVRLEAVLADLLAAIGSPRAAHVEGRVLRAEDAIIARLLASTGEEGRRVAKLVLQAAAARYADSGLNGGPSPLALDPDSDINPRFLLPLVGAVFNDLVVPFGDCTGRQVPALTSAVLDAAQPALWSPRARLAPDGATILDGKARIVATLTDEVGLNVLKATRGVLGHALIRYLAGEGARLGGVGHSTLVEIPGGFRELARRLNRTGRGSAATVRDAVIGLQRIQFRIPGMANGGGFLTWTELEESPRHRAHLRICLGDPLLPGFVHLLPDDRTIRGLQNKHLVPLPTTLPPLVSRGNEMGLQCVFQILVLQEMRRRVVHYARDGAIRLEGPTLRHLAEASGMPGRLIPAVLDAWSTGTEVAEPFLLRLGDDYYDLAPAYSNARGLLMNGARKSESASLAGKKGVASRGDRRSRHKGKRR